MPFGGTAVRILFTISCIFLLSTCAVTAVCAQEEQHQLTREQRKVERPIRDLPAALWQAIVTMPKPMQRVCIVQFFTWLAYFTFFIYMPDWMCKNVYGGRSKSDAKATPEEKELFQQGVQAGSFGLMLQAVVTLIVSVPLPRLMRLVGVKPVYATGLVALGVDIGATYFVRGYAARHLAVALVALNGIAWAVVITLPFILVAEASGKSSGCVVCWLIAFDLIAFV